MFRKAAAQTAPADDEIPEDALASIPDLAQTDEPEDLQAMVAELRASLQAAFAREMDHVERSFLAGLRDLHDRLASAEAESARLAQENAGLLRKVDGLKQLTKAIDAL